MARLADGAPKSARCLLFPACTSRCCPCEHGQLAMESGQLGAGCPGCGVLAVGHHRRSLECFVVPDPEGQTSLTMINTPLPEAAAPVLGSDGPISGSSEYSLSIEVRHVVTAEVGRGPSGSAATKLDLTEGPLRWLRLRRAARCPGAAARVDTLFNLPSCTSPTSPDAHSEGRNRFRLVVEAGPAPAGC